MFWKILEVRENKEETKEKRHSPKNSSARRTGGGRNARRKDTNRYQWSLLVKLKKKGPYT